MLLASSVQSVLSPRSSQDSLSSTSMARYDEFRPSTIIKSFTPDSEPIIYLSIPPRSPTDPRSSKEDVQPISGARALAMIVVCVTASIISNASSVSMNLLIPSIQRELEIEASNLQWISSGFPLGFGSCLLLFGRLADLFGHKRFIQLGTSFYALASLGCALSRTHVQLSILRVLQGLGAAATAPSIIGVLGNHLEPESMLKRVGFAGLSAGLPLGASFSMLVGGLITETTGAGWRSFFYFCAASASAICVSATLVIPKDKERVNDGGIDWLGGFLIITGLTGLILSLAISSREESNRTVVLLAIIFSLLILASFLYWQKVLEDRMNESFQHGEGWEMATEPILKLDLFKRDHHQFLVVLTVVCLLWFSFVSQNFFFHEYLQDFLGLSLRKSVIRFIPLPVVGLLLNITFGFVSPIVPTQLLIVFGCMGTATSCLLSALMNPSAGYWTYNFASVTLSVVGPGFVVPIAKMYSSQIASQSEQAVAGGLFHTVSQIGSAVGLSLTTLLQVHVTSYRSRQEGTVVNNDLTVASPEAYLDGLRAAFWLCFGVLCLATCLSVVFLRNLKLVGNKKNSSIEEDGIQKI
ncbi:hypothetical protein PtA15_8A547 [Puccinia triticina]|uniref:Major facilitator superfamily (MFS) profile domain-containing protein n=1 Tax=Puccinia triticina TaxID=208348 RepID=A0ABY7CU49_9BASI|nr:uncharacterized protein PtA15_8A547 [Puccinia triticina]WAQ87641.1 hypothetical protein PtA15_8A547 [Puccinia triticina]